MLRNQYGRKCEGGIHLLERLLPGSGLEYNLCRHSSLLPLDITVPLLVLYRAMCDVLLRVLLRCQVDLWRQSGIQEDNYQCADELDVEILAIRRYHR